MEVDKTLRRAARQLTESLEDEPIPAAPSRSRHALVVLVSTAVVTLAVVGGLALLAGRSGSAPTGNDPGSSTTSTPSTVAIASDVVRFDDSDRGFEVTYPATWYRADQVLAPALTSPGQRIGELVSLGTFPLRPGGDECPHVPLNALLDMADDDVLISIIAGDGTGGDPWPDTFGPDSFRPQPGPIDAEICSRRSDLDYRFGIFTLDGRQVQILLASGDSVTDATMAQTWHILDSFAWTGETTPTTPPTTTVTTTTSAPAAEPATGPLFGDPSDVVLLFDDGIDGVLALDPDKRVGSRSVIDGQHAGDPPYRLTKVGGSLVVGSGSVYASDIENGESTVLGDATIYVPAAEAERIWLMKWPGDRIGPGTPTAWQVDLAGNPITEPAEVNVDGYPAIGIPGGLAIETHDGIRLWYPDEGAADTGFGDGLAFVGDVSGDLMAFCPDQSCIDMLITDLRTQRTVFVSTGQGSNRSTFGARSARFSPDGTHLALTTEHGIVLANTETGSATTIADDLSAEPWSLYVAWSADGSQLFAATYSHGDIETTLARYEVQSGSLETATVPFGGTLDFVVLTPAEAARFLSDEDQSPSACPPVSGEPSGRVGVCGFRF